MTVCALSRNDAAGKASGEGKGRPYDAASGRFMNRPYVRDVEDAVPYDTGNHDPRPYEKTRNPRLLKTKN